jgi:DNA-binding transcriptional LysR family regulator
VVAEFLKAYQNINIRLVLADRVVNLLEDHIDLAIRRGASRRRSCRVPGRRDPPRGVREPGLFRRAWHAEEPR